MPEHVAVVSRQSLDKRFERERFGEEYLDIFEIYGMAVSYRVDSGGNILNGAIVGRDTAQARGLIRALGVKLTSNF